MKRRPTFCENKKRKHDMLQDMIIIFISFILLAVMNFGIVSFADAQTTLPNAAQVTIAEGDEWYYFKDLQKPPRDWKSTRFDYSGWQKGQSGFGYGIGSNRTYLGDMKGQYSTVYARHDFNISNIHAVTGLKLSVLCDGPFIAYLNNIEVIRTNTIQVSAPGQQSGIVQVEQFDISGFKHELFPRKNVLSVECSNNDINSDSFSFIPLFEVLGSTEVRQ